MFGLRQADIEVIQRMLKSYPEVKTAFIFGSRALGTYRIGSDIALKGYNLNPSAISSQLNEETQLPYTFDVLDIDSIENKALLEHIQRVGKPIYHG